MRKEADVNYRHATPTGSPWNEGKTAESAIDAYEIDNQEMCET